MTKKRVVLPVVVGPAPTAALSRRDVIQGILAATGLAVSAGAEAATVHHARAGRGHHGSAGRRARGGTAVPVPHQLETLEALAERIVPGSRAAKVAAFVDGQLAIEGTGRQQKFVEALSHFESLAIDGYARPFRALGAAEQDAILEAASTVEAGVPEDDRNWGWFQVPGTKAPGPPKYSSRDHFEEIKTRVSGAYYSSEIGHARAGLHGTDLLRWPSRAAPTRTGTSSAEGAVTRTRRLVAVLLSLALAACASPRPDRPRVALVMKSLANEFFKTMEDGARAHQTRTPPNTSSSPRASRTSRTWPGRSGWSSRWWRRG